MTQTFQHDGSLTAAGLQVTLPAGWSFVSAEGAGGPQVVPAAGKTGSLEFAWFTIPASPVQFTYIVAVPAGESGDKPVAARVLYRKTGAEQQTAVTPDPLVEKTTEAAAPAPSGGGSFGVIFESSSVLGSVHNCMMVSNYYGASVSGGSASVYNNVIVGSAQFGATAQGPCKMSANNNIFLQHKYAVGVST